MLRHDSVFCVLDHHFWSNLASCFVTSSRKLLIQDWPGNYNKKNNWNWLLSANFVASTSTYAIWQNKCIAANHHHFSKHKSESLETLTLKYQNIRSIDELLALLIRERDTCDATIFFDRGLSQMFPQSVIPSSPMHPRSWIWWRDEKQTTQASTLTWQTKYPGIVYRPGGMREASE